MNDYVIAFRPFSNLKFLFGKMVESNIYVLAKFALAKEIIFPFFLKKWWDQKFSFLESLGHPSELGEKFYVIYGNGCTYSTQILSRTSYFENKNRKIGENI
jgi:hypothetical protein